MSCQLNKLAVAVALKVLLSDFFCCYKCTTVPSIKKVDVFLMHLFWTDILVLLISYILIHIVICWAYFLHLSNIRR